MKGLRQSSSFLTSARRGEVQKFDHVEVDLGYLNPEA
jgi:hypothetical protein